MSISTTQLAKICGVSQGTVDRALNNRPGISQATKEKILEAAKAYNYRPNMHARSMAGGKTMLIGIVLFDTQNPYFSDLINAVEKECRKHGYSIVVTLTDRDPKREIQCVQSLAHMSVDGIIICPSESGNDYESFLGSLNIPVMTVGNHLSNIPHLGIDNHSSMSDALDYALEQGYKKLIYVRPDLRGNNAVAQEERYAAFLDYVTSNQIPFEETDRQNATEVDCTSERSAFVCPTDVLAVQLLKYAHEKNAGIIGFDSISILDTTGLKLDSMGYDLELTASLLVDNVKRGTAHSAIIPHKLIIRGSL